MKNILLKFMLLFGCLFYINNAFAICWSWSGECGGGDMNIDIKNDTSYTLELNNILTNRVSQSLNSPIIMPGGETSISMSYKGNASHSINPSISFDVIIDVSKDSKTQILLDSITQSIHGHFTCEENNPYGSGCEEGNIDKWENFKGSHTWYKDPTNNLSTALVDGISLNISKQKNNTYVYDYTMASNNPTDLPEGSNAWKPTDYAPSPYYGDVGK